MTPEVKSAIRTLLIALGAFGVGKGWFTTEELGSYVDALVVVLVAGVGVWGVWAKRPKSGEAQQVAEKVAQDPSVAPNIVDLSRVPPVPVGTPPLDKAQS